MNCIPPVQFCRTITQLPSGTSRHRPVKQQDAVLFGLSPGAKGLRLGLAGSLLILAGCSSFSPEKPDDEHSAIEGEKPGKDIKIDPEEPQAAPSAPTPTSPAPGTESEGSNPFAPDSTEPASPTPSATESPEPPAETEPPSPEPTEVPEPNAPSIRHVKLLAQNVWGIDHPGAGARWEARIKEVADIIRDYDVDLVTTSETTRPQFKRLKQHLGSGFRSFPSKYQDGRVRPAERAIFYKVKDSKGKALWQEKHSSVLKIPNYSDRGIHKPTRGMPWVHLVHAQTGQEVVLLSLHAVAWNKEPGTDAGGAQKRAESGRLIAAWANDMKQRFPNAVVIATGDINGHDYLRPPSDGNPKDAALGGDRKKLIPCLVGKELRAIDDIAANRKGACPPSTKHIDQAFTNADDAGGIRYINRRQSDHSGLLAWIKLFAAKAKIKVGEG